VAQRMHEGRQDHGQGRGVLRRIGQGLCLAHQGARLVEQGAPERAGLPVACIAGAVAKA
jgi:hypothetical protein